MKKYLTVSAFCLLLSACAHAPGPAPAPLDPPALAATDKEAHSLKVGEVEGQPNMAERLVDGLLRPYNELSNSAFNDMLHDSLAARNMLAPEETPEQQPARYIVETTIKYATPTTVATWNDLTVALQAQYRVMNGADRKEVWRKDVSTTRTVPAMMDGSVWKNILFVSAADVQKRASGLTNDVTMDNIREFEKDYNQWFAQQP